MKSLSLITLAMLLILSCKKDSGDLSALLAKRWRMTGTQVVTPLVGTALQGTSPNWYVANTCTTDRIWFFQQGGNFIQEAAGACLTQQQPIDIISGTWKLKNDKIAVNYTAGGLANFEFTVIEISQTTLRVQRNERVAVGNAVVLDLVIEYSFIPAV